MNNRASQSHNDSFERFYDKPLSKETVAEMRFNLKNYVKTLIQMDKQYQTWLKEQAENKNSESKHSED